MAPHQNSRFIKKVPQSAVGPAFKLSLPYDVVTTKLSHLVNQDFELVSSSAASSQQAWQGQIVPRRNKDRSEFTLKGWKLFAEAHDVRQGDHLSFELVSSHRLCIQNISRPASTTPHVLTPATSELNLSVVNESSMAPGQPDPKPSSPHTAQQMAAGEEDLVLPATHHAAMKQPGAFDDLEMEVWSSLGSAPQTVLPVVSCGESGPMDAERESGMVMAMEVPGGLGAAGSWPDLLGWGGDTTNSSQSRSDALPVPGSLPNLASSLFPPGHDWSAMTQSGQTTPEAGPQTPLTSALRNRSHDGSSSGHGGSPRRDPSSSALDTQMVTYNSAVRSLQNDVKRFELRAERAEREEVALRALLSNMRHDLNRALQASNGLERNMHQLTQSNMPARAESLQCIQVLKTSLWRLLSTDV